MSDVRDFPNSDDPLLFCLKVAAALAVDRDLEVSELIARGGELARAAAPPDGRVGLFGPGFRASILEVLEGLMRALYRDLTAPRVVEIACPRCSGKVQLQAERGRDDLAWRHSAPACPLFAAATVGIDASAPNAELVAHGAMVYRRRCLERATAARLVTGAELLTAAEHVQGDKPDEDPR